MRARWQLPASAAPKGSVCVPNTLYSGRDCSAERGSAAGMHVCIKRCLNSYYGVSSIEEQAHLNTFFLEHFRILLKDTRIPKGLMN